MSSFPFGVQATNVDPSGTIELAGSISIPYATPSSNGILSSTDYATLTRVFDKQLTTTISGTKNFTNGIQINGIDVQDLFGFLSTDSSLAMTVNLNVIPLPKASSTSSGFIDAKTYEKISNLAINVYSTSPAKNVSYYMTQNIVQTIPIVKVEYLNLSNDSNLIRLNASVYISPSSEEKTLDDSEFLVIGAYVPDGTVSQPVSISTPSMCVVGSSTAVVGTDITLYPTQVIDNVNGNFISGALRMKFWLKGPLSITGRTISVAAFIYT